MTRLLEKAIDEVRRLSAEQQDEAAEILLSIVAQDPDMVRLSAAQRSEVRRRLSESDLEYAAEIEASELYKKLGT